MFSAGINFILIFTSLNSVAPRLFHSRSPNDPYLSLVFSRPSSVLPAFFGWLLCGVRHPGGRQCHDGYNFSSFLSHISPPQTTRIHPPHTFRHGSISFYITHPMLSQIFGWLLHVLLDWRPPKAWAPPLSLFREGSHFGIQSSPHGAN